MKYIFAAIAFFILSLPISSAQTLVPLQPGETQFFISPIIICPTPPGCGIAPPVFTDFTETPQYMVLRGDFDHLDIGWDVKYFDNSERDIEVLCFLNCPNPGNNINVNCAGLQNCNYLGLTGPRSCTIPNPNYIVNLPPGNVNNVTCKFYDPQNKDSTGKPLEYLPYPVRTFRPIDYSISVSPITTTVGDEFNFPLSVIPLGLIPSTYSFNLTELSLPNVLSIERNLGVSEKLGYGRPGRFSPRVNYLVAKPTTIQNLVTGNADPITCAADGGCSYLGSDARCVIPAAGPGKCWKKLDLQLKSGNASLPEFDIFGFLQILFLSTAVLFLINFKKR